MTKVVEKLLKDPSSDVRERMAWNIGYIDNEKTRNTLIKNHIKDNDLGVRAELTSSINSIVSKDPETAKEFATIMSKDEDKFIQKEANDILNKIKIENQKDSYKLKITDGDKVVGEKKIVENRKDKTVFDSFFNAYKSIFEKSNGTSP